MCTINGLGESIYFIWFTGESQNVVSVITKPFLLAQSFSGLKFKGAYNSQVRGGANAERVSWIRGKG
jgi:hypothetical protein